MDIPRSLSVSLGTYIGFPSLFGALPRSLHGVLRALGIAGALALPGQVGLPVKPWGEPRTRLDQCRFLVVGM